MDIVTISWIGIEEDIIDAFVRHHANIADRMIIVLHGLQPKCISILDALHQEGFPIEIRQSRACYHRQSETLTELLHEVAADNPRLIVPLDADEFLVCNNGNVRGALSCLQQELVWKVRWVTYVPSTLDIASDPNPLTRITHRRDHEPVQYYKVIIPQQMVQPGVLLREGNHMLMQGKTPIPSRKLESVSIAHFPVRSASQIRRKIIRGWRNHMRNPNRQTGEAFQWEQLYNRCLSKEEITPEELSRIAALYAVPASHHAAVHLIHDPVLSPALA